MADPLSAVAGIVGIAAAAATLANAVYKFSDNISNARIQMHDVGSEMIHLSNILNTLDTVLKHGQGTYKPQVLTDTKSILDRVEKIHEEIRKIIKRNSGIRARMKWALSSGKVAELLDRIEALKSSLSIVLATVQLAMAHKEPRAPDMEIERLKQLMTAGVREIRQSVIALQQAKPTLMFEPPKMLTAGSPELALPDSAPTSVTVPSRRTPAADTEETFEPGRSQFETAIWLYQMTLSSTADPVTASPHEMSDQDDPSGSGKLATRKPSADEKTPIASTNLVSSSPIPSHLIKLPPPQRLYEISVLVVARRIIRTWTFLEPAEVLLEDDGGKKTLSGASVNDSSSEDDQDDEGDRREKPRRRFTAQEYGHALETGDIHDSSYRPQKPSEQRPPQRRRPEGQSSEERSSEEQSDKQTVPEEGPPQEARFQQHFTQQRPPPQPPSTWSNDAHAGTSRIPRGTGGAKSKRQQPLGPDPPPPPFPDPFSYPYPYPYPPPPQPPPDTTNVDSVLNKLSDLLLGKAEDDASKAAEAQKAAELARLDRIETLLIAQQEAEFAKHKAKERAAAEAVAKAAEAKKLGDERTLASLEKLILQQKEEQLLREAAADAARKAAAETANAEALKISGEKIAAAEAAKMLLDAASKARELAEKRASEEALEIKKAHEKAIKDAKEEVERMVQEERKLRKKAEKMLLPPPPPILPPPPPPPLISHSEPDEVLEKVCLAATSLVDIVYGKEEKKWYMTARGPELIDISDGYLARRILSNAQDEDEDEDSDSDADTISFYRDSLTGSDIPKSYRTAELMQLLTTSDRYYLVFPNVTQQTALEENNLTAALQLEGIETLFEIDTDESKSLMLQLRNAVAEISIDESRVSADAKPKRRRGDMFVNSSLLWQRLPKDGQSELYQSLCRTGWMPTYLRSSESGQTWFYGDRPIHVRFNHPDYVPRFTDFENVTTHACVIIGTDIVDVDALCLTGIDYEPLQTGYWMLEATLTYEDITTLVATTFMLRETSLRRVARKALNTSASSLSRSRATTVPPKPEIPPLQASSQHLEPSVRQEDTERIVNAPEEPA